MRTIAAADAETGDIVAEPVINAQAARLLNRDLDEKTVAKLQMIEAQVKRISEVTERLRTMDQVESDDYIADGPKMIDLGTRENESD